MNLSATQKKENTALPWVAWVATIVSFIVGGAVARIVAGPVVDPLSGLLAGAMSGAFVGAAQWLALQFLLSRSRGDVGALGVFGAQWAAATAAGVGIGVAAGAALVSFRTGALDLAAMGFVTGASTGALQAWMLKERVPASWRWLVLNPPLWAASWLVTLAIGVDASIRWAMFGASGAILYTVVAGFVLRSLLRRPVPVAPGTGVGAGTGAEKVASTGTVENVAELVNIGGVN